MDTNNTNYQQAITHVLEYLPYPNRNECCAIGLLAFRPGESARLHLADDLRKLPRMQPACNLDELRARLEELADAISADRDLLQLYTNGRVGPLRVSSEPGVVNYKTEEQYQRGIAWTLSEMCSPAPGRPVRERHPTSRLFLTLKDYFANEGWLGSSRDELQSHRIIPRCNLVPEAGITVDFALKNGRLHLLQTADFRQFSNATAKRAEAQSKLYALGISDAFTKHEFGLSKKYLFLAGSDTDEGRKAIRTASKFVEVFCAESAADIEELGELYRHHMRGPSTEPIGESRSLWQHMKQANTTHNA